MTVPVQAAELIEWAVTTYGDRFAITTSFQREGMILIDMAARIGRGLRVLTIDTGRLPEATHRMMDTVRERYGIPIELIVPAADEVAAMVKLHGANLFYNEAPLRKLCCQIRKVRPLDIRLHGVDAYAAGLRREQSEERERLERLETSKGKQKIYPLLDWTAAEVDEYIRRHNVPQHPLYAEGYTSIGCAPCTRATASGEAERAGRWWWENEGDKECGLHFTPEGETLRAVDVLLKEVLAAR